MNKKNNNLEKGNISDLIPQTKEGKIDYSRDRERYDQNQFCGTCKYSIQIYGDGKVKRCEQCDDEYGDSNISLVFCENCPCYCYYCTECDRNVLELDEEEDKNCEHGDHKETQKHLLNRLGA